MSENLVPIGMTSRPQNDMANDVASKPQFDQIVFDSGLVRIGAFRCHPANPSFQDTGPARNYCFVFPRTAVEIQHEHEIAFVANSNVVTFYNSGQNYSRNAISPEGDNCDWFGVESHVVREVVRIFDPHVDDYPERPFQVTRGWADPSTYLLQRTLFSRATSGEVLAPLGAEETVVELLTRVVNSVYSGLRRATPLKISTKQRDIIRDVETILSRDPEERLALKQIASSVGSSPFHLCRLFRKVTGMKLHQYRLRFRLRASLSEVVESARPLTDIALQTGFSSHSHFTESFRNEFAVTPSALRDERSKPV